MKHLTLLPLAALFAVTTALAEPVTYDIEPDHTYPSFEADHMGLSIWRGKFNKTSGTVTLDKTAGTGALDVTVDIASVDFGHDKMNEHAVKPDIFNAEKFPSATYKGKLVDFKDGAPTRVTGELTLMGVTQPLDLKINAFKCIPHPFYKREACGADASAQFKRDAFGLDVGKPYGFNMDVTVRISVEAIAAQ